MVGVDVEAESPIRSFQEAINKVREQLGENPSEPMPKPAWVTGIVQCDPHYSAHTAIEGYMVFETSGIQA